MKYRFEFAIVASALLCLLLAQVAPANVVKKCFIDGNDVAQQTGPMALNYNFHRLTVAAEGNLWYRYNGLIGAIDEFAIYDKVLEDPCIVAHANTPPANYVATVTADAPVLWLRFEDPCSANGYTAADSSGNGQNGTYIGDGPGGQIGDVNLVAGFVGNAAEFYGTADGNGTCIDVNDANGALELQDLTVEFWLKSTNLYGHYSRFFQHNGGNEDANGYGAHMMNDPNDPVVGLIGGGTVAYDPVGEDMNDGEWHHVVFTFDSTYQPPPPNEVNSYVEEVNDDNPVLWVRFEDENPSDYSGNGNWVGYGNIDIVKAGGIGKVALQDSSTDGGGNYVAAVAKGPNTPPYEDWNQAYALVPNDISIEFWYKSLPAGEAQAPQYSMLCQQIGPYTNEPNGPAFGTSDGQIRIFCGAPGHGTGIWYTGRYPYDEEWHHIVVTYDEEYQGDPCSIHMQLYYDSDLSEYTSSDSRIALLEGLGVELSHMVLGAANNRGYSYSIVPGYYDEFAIYDGILDPNRVLAHYVAWQPRNCQEAIDRGYGTVGDLNSDCKIDFKDIATWALTLTWRKCNDPCDPNNCPPNW